MALYLCYVVLFIQFYWFIFFLFFIFIINSVIRCILYNMFGPIWMNKLVNWLINLLRWRFWKNGNTAIRIVSDLIFNWKWWRIWREFSKERRLTDIFQKYEIRIAVLINIYLSYCNFCALNYNFWGSLIYLFVNCLKKKPNDIRV